LAERKALGGTDILGSILHFYLHMWFFKIRDLLIPRGPILEYAGIRPGFHVVDYGCGPGSYVLLLSQMVGGKGRVYAFDIEPLAIKNVKGLISRAGLVNAEAACSDCRTGLPDNSVDMVLLYDVFHALKEPDKVLRELHRILKPEGALSLQDHRMGIKKAINNLTKAGYFRFSGKGKRAYRFLRT